MFIARSAYVQILIAVAILCSYVGAQSLADNNSSTQASNRSHFPRLGLWLDPELSIDKIDAGSASDRAGLKVGDRIASIEGRQVAQLSAGDRFHLLTGETGTVSHLVIIRGTNPYSVAITRSEPFSPRSVAPVQASPQIANAQPSELDRELIVIEGRTAYTDETYQQVLKGLSLLPPEVKQAFLHYGTKVEITPRSSALDDEGGCCYAIKDNKVIMHEPVSAEMNRFPITTLHELGHAYDWMSGRISTSAEFHQCYDDDLSRAKLTPEMSQNLAHFLQPGQRGKSECFASLFARKYFKEPDRRLQYLEITFPTASKFVERLKP